MKTNTETPTQTTYCIFVRDWWIEATTAGWPNKRGRTIWNDLTSKWFFSGVNANIFVPKDGIDKDKALRQIKTCIGSFEPKHEHKEAGVAYLMSLFFVEPPPVTKA